MTTGGQREVAEPSIFTSLWRHSRLIGIVIAVFAVVGLLVASARSPEYAAEAGAQLEDQSPAALSATPTAKDQARYIADQTAILKSIAVSTRASEIMRTASTPKTIDPQELQRRTSIVSSDLSNYVLVRVRAGDPETARALANAVVAGYEDLMRSTFEAEAEAAIRRLDAAMPAIAERVARDTSKDSSALLAEIRKRRRDLVVDSALVGDGVTVFTPAEPGKAQGVSRTAILTISVVLGALVAAGIAWWLDARRQSFSNRFEPQPLLDAPSLAEIPDFAVEGLHSSLPVLDAPGTRSAEAFRFLAFDIGLPPASSNGHAPPRSSRGGASAGALTVAFVAADPGDGTTTLAANSALAAAHEGWRVLVVDPELGGDGPTRLLAGAADGSRSEGPSRALGRPRQAPRQVLETSAHGSLSLLGLAAGADDSMSATRLEHLVTGLDSGGERFDLVVIDVPPILHVALAGALLRSADAVVVVVPHASEVVRLRNVRHRLDLLGIRPVGYVYNLGAPARGVWPWRALSGLAGSEERRVPAAGGAAGTGTGDSTARRGHGGAARSRRAASRIDEPR